MKNNIEGKKYGFIAQEIQEVLPEMCKVQSEYIPNIYKVATYDIIDKIINVDFEYNIMVGKKLKILEYNIKVSKKLKILEQDTEDYKFMIITEKISDSSFKIDRDLEKPELFIYGEYVDDFNVIGNEYLHAVTVSAVQELHRKITAQRTEINDLKETLNFIMNHLNL